MFELDGVHVQEWLPGVEWWWWTNKEPPNEIIIQFCRKKITRFARVYVVLLYRVRQFLQLNYKIFIYFWGTWSALEWSREEERGGLE